jgi:hypothetical protein
MMLGRLFAAASVLAVIVLLPATARAEYRRIDLKIAGMD